MNGAAITKIAIVVFFLLIRFIVKSAAKKARAAGPPPTPGQNSDNPFQQNQSTNQNPFEQNQSTNQNPFQNPQNPFEQQQNPFQSNPPAIPNPFAHIPKNQNPSTQETNIETFFDDRKDAFSQASTRNDNSNMGAGTQSFYCRYCGKKFSSVENLTRDTCFKHPNSDQGLQKHVLYQGAGRPNVGF